MFNNLNGLEQHVINSYEYHAKNTVTNLLRHAQTAQIAFNADNDDFSAFNIEQTYLIAVLAFQDDFGITTWWDDVTSTYGYTPQLRRKAGWK